MSTMVVDNLHKKTGVNTPALYRYKIYKCSILWDATYPFIFGPVQATPGSNPLVAFKDLLLQNYYGSLKMRYRQTCTHVDG